MATYTYFVCRYLIHHARLDENYSCGTNDMSGRESTKYVRSKIGRQRKLQRKITDNLEYLNSDEGVERMKSDSPSIVKALSSVSCRQDK